MDAVIIAGQIANALDYVGVMGVEFFVTSKDGLLVNEIAPRVHNSGHWTQNGCCIDQFEQHIRAIIGSKLGNGERHSNVKMVNILGEDINKFKDITDAAIHMYGKEEVLPGRKMGHVNYSSQKNKTF
jgi:5-(carboxyamino)imidazole ribonucleotide synthase